jgi:hypothetical protein
MALFLRSKLWLFSVRQKQRLFLPSILTVIFGIIYSDNQRTRAEELSANRLFNRTIHSY